MSKTSTFRRMFLVSLFGICLVLTVALCALGAFPAGIESRPPGLNVKDFGARGNGVADDTQMIQALLDRLKRGGGRIYLPAGTYLVGPLTFPSKVIIEGDGPGTLLKWRGGKGFVLSPSAAQTGYLRISNLAIDMRGAANVGIDLVDCWHSSVSKVIISNVPPGTYIQHGFVYPDAGITLRGTAGVSGAYYNTIEQCEVSGEKGSFGERGYYFSSTTENSGQKANFNKISNCSARHCRIGFDLANGNDCYLKADVAAFSRIGIRCNSDGAVITDPGISNAAEGILIEKGKRDNVLANVTSGFAVRRPLAGSGRNTMHMSWNVYRRLDMAQSGPGPGSFRPAWTINVKALGAQGNGRSDDTRAIQAALDRAAWIPGGRVYLPAGIYRVGPLFFPSDVIIEGDGAATVLKWKGGRGFCFSVQQPLKRASHVWIKDMSVDSDDAANVGISLYGCRYSLVSRVNIYNVPDGTYKMAGAVYPDAGIAIVQPGSRRPSHNTLDRCNVSGKKASLARTGFYISAPSGRKKKQWNRTRLIQCRALYCKTGIDLAGDDGCYLEMPQVSNTVTGVHCACNGTVIFKPYAEDCKTAIAVDKNGRGNLVLFFGSVAGTRTALADRGEDTMTRGPVYGKVIR
ncbi:MAG: glycosyl hydrolase family 28-related protein [Nitrospiraceae bacterium]|nr:glycosyl hydrolase family 28-related protein [Nitrospiraceae bacterium]